MVVLNEHISFNIKKLKLDLISNMKCFVGNALEFYISEQKIEKVQNNIEKNIRNLFSNDNFIYLNMNDNYCTHKFKKGKKDGHFCNRKINTNLEGQKQDYLCCAHSKRHIPKKRNKKIVIKENKNEELNKFVQPHNFIFKFKNKDTKKITKRKRNNKKIFICNGGLLNIGLILTNLL